MEDKEYETRAHIEDRMWWFRASHAIQLRQMERFHGNKTGCILDAGCGTGGILRKIHNCFGKASVVGLDFNDKALTLAARNSATPLVQASVNQLPFSEDVFSGFLSSDVYYHKGVDPELAMKEAYRCLSPGGVMVLTDSAYEWMKSVHDKRVHGARRYTRGRLVEAMRSVGLEVLYATYWNSFLFPLMVLRRRMFRSEDGRSDAMNFPPLLDTLFHMVMVLERAVLRTGLRLPFGGSVLVVGRKPITLNNPTTP